MLQHKIYDKPNLRMIVEAMLYRMGVALGENSRQILDAGIQFISNLIDGHRKTN